MNENKWSEYLEAVDTVCGMCCYDTERALEGDDSKCAACMVRKTCDIAYKEMGRDRGGSMSYPKYMEQGCCARCGSRNVYRECIDGGGPGENILVFFFCGDCECEFMELYEYTCKGIFEQEEK